MAFRLLLKMFHIFGPVRKIFKGHQTENIHPLVFWEQEMFNITFLQMIRDRTCTRNNTDL